MKAFKKILLVLTLCCSTSILALAQSTATQADQAPVEPSIWMKLPDYIDNPILWLLILVGFVLIMAIYALSRSITALTEQLYGKKVEEKRVEKERVKKVTGWEKMMKRLTQSVPVEQEADVMLDHNYDGIRELDNKLPPWWKWGFYLTIVIAFCYLFYYHASGKGKLMIAEYNDEMAQAEHEKAERMKLAANNITDANVVAFTDETNLSEGKATFEKNCIACHGNAGQGNVGPNLTDEYWLHGGGIKNIFHTITEGVPAKGMITWKTQLAPKQIQQVASFILTLKGTNPPGAKDPQGDKWVEESKADSSSVAKTDTIAMKTPS